MPKTVTNSVFRIRMLSFVIALASALLLVLYDQLRGVLPIQLEYWAGGVLYVMFWSFLFHTIILDKLSPLWICLTTTLTTCLIEFSQLWHPPFLEGIRSYEIGYAILGTTFSWSDFPPYFLGGYLSYALSSYISKLSLRAFKIFFCYLLHQDISGNNL